MTIKVDRKEFIDALTIGSAMDGKAKTMPILNLTKITTSQIAMTITSFDLECSITKRCDVISCDTIGEFCVCANDLIKAIKALKNDEITLVVDNNLLTILHASGTMSMPVQNATTFPAISQGEDFDEHVYVLSSGCLKEWVMISRNFVADDDFRPIMNGMYIHVTPSNVEVCATDAHKLYTDSIDVDYVSGVDIEAVLPSRAFSPLLTILNGVDEVTMNVDDKNFIFTTNDTTLTCRKVEGNYPNFKAIIPNHPTAVELNKTEFIQALSRVALFVDANTSLVKLNVSSNKIDMEGSDIDFAKMSKDSVNASMTRGESLSIGAKANFLTICASNVFSDNIIVEFGAFNQPMLLKDSMRPNKTILLMPMMIQ
jgi:DNA polymerase-3 subunit beta